MSEKVLLVEDDDAIREIIADYFIDAGYLITEVPDGEKAMELFEMADYDLILLDIMLPYIDGFTLCRRFRSKKSVPIIILTARSAEDDKLLGYELGADDYIEKPFNPKILLAKVRNLLMRAEGRVGSFEGILAAGNITVNLLSYSVTANGENIELTPKEFHLLEALIQNKNTVMTREVLLSKVWGYDYFGDERVVDTHIKSLRKKLKGGAQHITTKIKAGYMFDENINF